MAFIMNFKRPYVTLFFFLLIFLIVELCFAQYSTTFVQTSAPSANWYSIASSASGQYLAAVIDGGGIYTSEDYGYVWTQTSAPSSSWGSIASSSSGQYLCAAQFEGGIFTSSDFGESWNQTSAEDSGSVWVSVTSDSSGQYLAAALRSSGIWTSDDYGVSWSLAYSASVYWQAVTSSSNGSHIAAVYNGGGIYDSSNYGGSWITSNAPSETWYGVTSDSTGQYMYAVVAEGGIYMSTDYGASWAITSASSNNWDSVSTDDSGQCLFAGISGGSIYYSLDYGSTWSEADAPSEAWSSVTVSSDCQYVTAVISDSGIFANFYSPTSSPSNSPTAPPSGVPTLSPSFIPTSQPSSQPSASPTSYPTYTSSSFEIIRLVTSTTAKSSYVFTGVGCDSVAYLSATIEVSYLSAGSGGYINITAGSGATAINVTTDCAPSTSCGSITCFVNEDVSTALSCHDGGQLAVYADTVNAQDATGALTLCDYQGSNHLQYAISYTLSSNPIPTSLPTLAPTQSSNTPIVFEASPNAPFFVIATIALLYIALGVILVRTIDKNPTSFAEISLLATCCDLAMIGYHLSSELFYIIVLFSEGLASLGIVIIIIRLCSVIPALYFIAITLGPPKYSQHYSKLLNQSHLFKNAPTFSVVILLMMFEQSMVRYFPWNASNFTKLSRGFPDQHLFQVCMIPKLLQLMTTLIIQIVVVSSVDADILHGGSNPIAATLVIMYLISSVLLFVMFTVTNVIRMGVAEERSHDDSLEDGKDHTNPIHSVEGVGRGAELIQSLKIVDVGDVYKNRIEYLEDSVKQLIDTVKQQADRENYLSDRVLELTDDVKQLSEKEQQLTAELKSLRDMVVLGDSSSNSTGGGGEVGGL